MSIHIGEGITTVTATMYKTGKTPAGGTSTTAILIGGAAAVAIVGLAAMSKKKR
jgi:hypothetical protein